VYQPAGRQINETVVNGLLTIGDFDIDKAINQKSRDLDRKRPPLLKLREVTFLIGHKRSPLPLRPTSQCLLGEIGRRPARRVQRRSMVDFFRMVKKGEQIGKVTSARRALRRASVTAMGPSEHSELGTELEVETRSEGIPLWWSPSS
jgi:hypothetical protein